MVRLSILTLCMLLPVHALGQGVVAGPVAAGQIPVYSPPAPADPADPAPPAPAPTVTDLALGELAQDLAGAQGEWLYFRLTTPYGPEALELDLFGGTGDADLYIRHGDLPTESAYHFTTAQTGNYESLEVAGPPDGDWYLGIHGYTDFAGVSLVGDVIWWLPTQTLYNGAYVTDLAGTYNSWRYYRVHVFGNPDELEVRVRGGSGDVNIYVNDHWEPSIASYIDKTFGGGTWKTLRIPNPENGTYYIGLRGGYSQYQDVSLRVWAF